LKCTNNGSEVSGNNSRLYLEIEDFLVVSENQLLCNKSNSSEKSYDDLLDHYCKKLLGLDFRLYKTTLLSQCHSSKTSSSASSTRKIGLFRNNGGPKLAEKNIFTTQTVMFGRKISKKTSKVFEEVTQLMNNL